MASIVDGAGTECEAPAPKARTTHRPLSEKLKRRNDHVLALSRAGASDEEIRDLTGLKPETIRGALREARDRNGNGPLPVRADNAKLVEELLNTPMTADPSGPRYRDHPEAAAWIREHAHEL